MSEDESYLINFGPDVPKIWDDKNAEAKHFPWISYHAHLALYNLCLNLTKLFVYSFHHLAFHIYHAYHRIRKKVLSLLASCFIWDINY